MKNNVWVNQKRMIMGLLISIMNAYNHAKIVSLSNQKCMIQPTFTNLNYNKYSQKFHCYPFAVKLDRCVGSCNTLKGAEATCVDIATEIKKCFRLKELLNFNILRNF